MEHTYLVALLSPMLFELMLQGTDISNCSIKTYTETHDTNKNMQTKKNT